MLGVWILYSQRCSGIKSFVYSFLLIYQPRSKYMYVHIWAICKYSFNMPFGWLNRCEAFKMSDFHIILILFKKCKRKHTLPEGRRGSWRQEHATSLLLGREPEPEPRSEDWRPRVAALTGSKVPFFYFNNDFTLCILRYARRPQSPCFTCILVHLFSCLVSYVLCMWIWLNG